MLEEQIQFPTTCHTCGYRDTNELCSRCGTLLIVRQTDADAGVHFWSYITEKWADLFAPLLAAFKTFWLVALDPVAFFRVRMMGEGTMHALTFPLTGFWRRLGQRFQHALEPLTTFIAALTLFLLLNPTIFEILREGILLPIPFLEDITHTFITEGVIFIALVYVLMFFVGFAGIFRLSLGKGHDIGRRHVYDFWLYIFSTFIVIESASEFLSATLVQTFAEVTNPFAVIPLQIIVAISDFLFLPAAIWLIFVVPFVVFRPISERRIPHWRIALGLLAAVAYTAAIIILLLGRDALGLTILFAPVYVVLNITPLLLVVAGMAAIVFTIRRLRR